MTRRRSTAWSSTEKRVVGDLAFRELLTRALPLLAPGDRRIIDLLQGGAPSDEVAMLMNEPCEVEIDASIARAQDGLARACRTVAATASLLEEGGSCQEFAHYATWWRRLMKRRNLLQADLTEASRNYQRYAMVTDPSGPYLYIDDYLCPATSSSLPGRRRGEPTKSRVLRPASSPSSS